MSTATLHYIFDPLCAWCYGAAPLIRAAQNLPGLRIALHAGGMMAGDNRRNIDDEWRRHVLPHDKRIAQLTGQPFGEAYFNGLLHDTTAVLDSEQPITAILAAEALGGHGWRCCTGCNRRSISKGAALPIPRCWNRWQKSLACPRLCSSPKCGLSAAKQRISTLHKAASCWPAYAARVSRPLPWRIAAGNCGNSRWRPIWATPKAGKRC